MFIPISIQPHPYLRLVLFAHLIWGTSDAAMVSVVVGLEHLGKDILIAPCLRGCEVGPNLGLNSAIEHLHHCRFLVTVADEMGGVVAFKEALHLFVEKLLTGISMEPLGFPRISLFEESLECR